MTASRNTSDSIGPSSLTPGSVTVHKFGGTSVGGPDQFCQVRDIIVRLLHLDGEKPLVVVSAMAGVTSKLYACISHANERKEFDEILSEISSSHVDCVRTCLGQGQEERMLAIEKSIKSDICTIAKHLQIIKSSSSHQCPDLISDVIVSYGEIWSAQILAALLAAAAVRSCWINARDFLFLQNSSKEVRVDWKRSHCPFFPPEVQIAVITGFLATSAAGLPTTLKRNGSDHSGAIVANLANAKSLIIWTDVDGIYSADPRLVKTAKKLNCMSYKEAAELAYFGAKVIHPQTVAPCVSKSIPVILRNTFNLNSEGTTISSTAPGEIRAVTIIPRVALVNVEGSGLFGFSGIAAKLFAAVSAAETNIIMITQASSEYSICFAVPQADAGVCEDAVRLAFASEIEDKCIEVSRDSAAIVAIVGDGMHRQKGFLGKLATALGEDGVNIRAVAQGSSERNITFVVNEEDGVKALSSLHSVL